MEPDLYRVECALSGTLPLEDLTAEERDVFQREGPAFEIGQMANRFVQGYYAHSVAAIVARAPSAASAFTALPGQAVPIETVPRKNGTTHIYDSQHYLNYFNTLEISQEVARLWLSGTLLMLGDALCKHQYFGHKPELEMVYHLRNGIAHDNRFRLKPAGLNRLQQYPAHNRTALVRVGNAEFEITPCLDGKQVLFDFMGPGDVLDLLQSINLDLMHLRGRL